MKIAFDIDDTLGYMFGAAIDYFNIKFGKNYTPEFIHAELKRGNYPYTTDPLGFVYGVSKQEVGEIFLNHTDVIFKNCKPYNDALALVKKYADEGHEIYYITARNAKWVTITKAWLLQYEFPQGTLIHEHKKADLAAQLGIDIFYEDNINNALSISAKGIKVYLITSIANYHDVPNHIERVSWAS